MKCPYCRREFETKTIAHIPSPIHHPIRSCYGVAVYSLKNIKTGTIWCVCEEHLRQTLNKYQEKTFIISILVSKTILCQGNI